MTTIRMKGIRAFAALLLLAVLIAAISRVSAQDAADTANEAASPASYGAEPDIDPVDPIGTVEVPEGEPAGEGVGVDSSSPSEGEPEGTVEETIGDEPLLDDTSGTPASYLVIDNGGVELASPEGGAVTDDVIEAPEIDVFVTIYAYDCNVDPGDSDPSVSADCTPSSGVDVAVSGDGIPPGIQTTGIDGSVTFAAPVGGELVLSEDTGTIAAGFHAAGNGTAFLTAAEGASVTFVHLADAVVGRLQIVNGSCPTSGESHTEFRVIEPRSVVEASVPACQVTGGTVFTILGESLGDGGIAITTGGDGAWRGYLLPGDYTVVDDSGASAGVTVIADDVSVVIVVDYISAPLSVLQVSRFSCTVHDQSATEISFSVSEPSVGDDDGCEPTDGGISIDLPEEVSAAEVASFELGDDGVEEIELPPGSYILTDLLTGESRSFDLDGGTRLYALVQELKIGDDGVGGDPDGTATPTKRPDDGTGGGGTEPTPTATPAPGDGTGTDNSGGNTDGGLDTGSSDNGSGDDGEELAGVTTLPSAGAHISGRDQTQAYLMFALLAVALCAGGVGGRRILLRRAD